LPEFPLHDIWERLVGLHRVSGKDTHDARLVAAMLAHQVGSILTFNVQDFARYPQVAVIDPKALSPGK
jgi:predicted nucleic acid-binding protein